MSHDLPSELKAFEASLAALAPRADGLDHDLLMFQAGQRSAMRKIVRRRRAIMPIALVAMTSAAAALFVMLLTRPVVERIEIVYTPVVEQESEIEIDVDVDVDIQDATPADDRFDDGSANYWAYSPTRPYRVRALALERLDEMLRQEMNPQSRPAVAPSQGSPPMDMEVKAPVPYYQQLQDLLDDQAS